MWNRLLHKANIDVASAQFDVSENTSRMSQNFGNRFAFTILKAKAESFNILLAVRTAPWFETSTSEQMVFEHYMPILNWLFEVEGRGDSDSARLARQPWMFLSKNGGACT